MTSCTSFSLVCLFPQSPNVMHHSKLRSKSKSKSRERQDTSSQPAHHASKTANSFQNPWMQPKGLLESGQVLSQFPLAFEKRLEASHITPTKVITPDFGGDKSSGEAIKATWLGHAVRSKLSSLRLYADWDAGLYGRNAS
jgi:hypothetical protein